jgi:hypothetical protein
VWSADADADFDVAVEGQIGASVAPQEVCQPWVVEIRLLLAKPTPVYLVRHPPTPRSAPLDWSDLLSLDGELGRCEFRGVGVDRLSTVLSTVIDVEPSTAPIYAGAIDKAWEYGGNPKVVLALLASELRRSWVEVEADTNELAAIRTDYSTVIPSDDGTRLWCSRLPADDVRVATSYEAAYCWWIPGDAFKVLRAVFIFVEATDSVEERELLMQAFPGNASSP